MGKNLATIMAADRLGARDILIVTTVSGRAVSRRAFEQNQQLSRTIQVAEPKHTLTGNVVIVSWSSLVNPIMQLQLLSRRWDLIIADESHFAKNFGAKRTRALYGIPVNDGRGLDQKHALAIRADRFWCLSGTPAAHDLGDLYPMLRTLAPELLLAGKGFPDVTAQTDFDSRYTIQKLIRLSPYTTKMVKVGGRNEHELKSRLGGFMLRRTQQQVGILPARFALRPVAVSAAQQRELERDVDRRVVLEAIDSGSVRDLEMHLGKLLRKTGEIKARIVVDALGEEFDCGLTRIVLGYWHRDVGAILKEGLADCGVVGIDGSTPFNSRAGAIEVFSKPGGPRVFLQQLEAAGESIDLSAADTLWFVESTFSPRQMNQAAQRIVNLNRNRSPLVETIFIEDSIDEVVQDALMRLWLSIRLVVS